MLQFSCFASFPVHIRVFFSSVGREPWEVKHIEREKSQAADENWFAWTKGERVHALCTQKHSNYPGLYARILSDVICYVWVSHWFLCFFSRVYLNVSELIIDSVHNSHALILWTNFSSRSSFSYDRYKLSSTGNHNKHWTNDCLQPVATPSGLRKYASHFVEREIKRIC